MMDIVKNMIFDIIKVLEHQHLKKQKNTLKISINILNHSYPQIYQLILIM